MNRKQLLKMLGTYWSRHFQDDKTLTGLLEGQLALQKQVETNWEELSLSAFRKHIPVYHTEHVYTLNLDPERRNDTPAAYVRYGDSSAAYSEPPVNNADRWLAICDRFGLPRISTCWYRLPLDGVISVDKIVDNPVSPTIELRNGIDFQIAYDSVTFTVDPCLDGKPKELFLVGVKQDLRWIYRHFGYLLNLESKSSETYRKLVDDIFNAYINGASSVDVFSVLAEVTGNALAKETETVIEVLDQLVTTDKNKYKILPGHTINVREGDKLAPGDSLTNEFTQIHINQLAQPHELPAVLLPKKYLGNEYLYGLAFVNVDVPLFTVNGQSRFVLGGNRNDVERFWKDFEEHCVALTKRQRKSGQLKETDPDITVNTVLARCVSQYTQLINPYRFFTEHIGRYHFTLLAIDYVKYPTDLTLDYVPLRQLMPPWSALLIQQKLTIEHSTSISGISDDDIEIEIIEYEPPVDYTISGQIYVGLLNPSGRGAWLKRPEPVE